VTDQSQSGPPERADAGSEPAGDVPAASAYQSTGDVPTVLGPDTPTEVSPPAPPPPPPAIAAAMDGQDVEMSAAVAPLEPGESPAVSPPPAVPPAPEWRPEDDLSSGGPAALAAERPEIAVGAAFAGGLVLALILKRLAR
jgi:hypothetical protein